MANFLKMLKTVLFTTTFFSNSIPDILRTSASNDTHFTPKGYAL
jgi:hypothetical protein